MIPLNFKEWLLKEDVEYQGDLTGDLFIPTNADDYSYSNSDPGDLWWLQWKWDQERKHGRKFIGIDLDAFEKIKYLSLKSNTLPNNLSWKHREDNRTNLDALEISNLNQLGFDGEILKQRPMVTMPLPLDKIFKDKNSGSWQQMAKDEPFTDS